MLHRPRLAEGGHAGRQDQFVDSIEPLHNLRPMALITNLVSVAEINSLTEGKIPFTTSTDVITGAHIL